MTRREFVPRLLVLGAAPACLVACAPPREHAADLAGAIVDSSTCAGYATLDPAQERVRESFGYVDATPAPDRLCTGCRFYAAPAGSSPCGGCSLFHGPVSPGGSCRSWAPAPSAA